MGFMVTPAARARPAQGSRTSCLVGLRILDPGVCNGYEEGRPGADSASLAERAGGRWVIPCPDR